MNKIKIVLNEAISRGLFGKVAEGKVGIENVKIIRNHLQGKEVIKSDTTVLVVDSGVTDKEIKEAKAKFPKLKVLWQGEKAKPFADAFFDINTLKDPTNKMSDVKVMINELLDQVLVPDEATAKKIAEKNVLDKRDEVKQILKGKKFVREKVTPRDWKKLGVDISKLDQADLIIIGASTGGPKALEVALKKIPKDLNKPIIIVQHMLDNFTTFFAKNLGNRIGHTIYPTVDNAIVENGKIYVAESGIHTTVEFQHNKYRFKLEDGPSVNGVKPAIDVTWESLAKNVSKKKIVSFMLTGLGKDGAAGVKAVKAESKEFFQVTQTEESCVVYGMPKAVDQLGLTDVSLDLEQMSDLLGEISHCPMIKSSKKLAKATVVLKKENDNKEARAKQTALNDKLVKMTSCPVGRGTKKAATAAKVAPKTTEKSSAAKVEDSYMTKKHLANNRSSDPIIAKLQEIIELNSGFIVTNDKSYLLEAKLQHIIDKYKHKDLEGLGNALEKEVGNSLLVEVLSSITINETHWFRDRGPWNAILECLPQWIQDLKLAKKKKIRILSAACSTGQEPYSIVLKINEYLIENDIKGIKLNMFEVIACDIDNKSLAYAKAGLYDKLSMSRGMPEVMLNEHFKPVGKKWQLNINIRNRVKFSRENLIGDLDHLGMFDAIFCRYVLIYFKFDVKKTIIKKFVDQLNKDGIMIIGGSEIYIGYKEQFDKVKIVGGTYYKKKGTK